MKAAYGIDYSKNGKTALCLFLVLYFAALIYLIVRQEWGPVISFSLNLVVFYFILRRSNTRHIQITNNDRLMLGVHQVEIKAIDRIEFYDSCAFRIYYTFDGEPRISSKIQLKEKDKEDFLNTLTAINPDIQIN